MSKKERLKRILTLVPLLLFGLLCIAFSYFSLGCTSVVPNAEVCADKGMLGAKCAFTRNGKERSMTKPQWDRTRVGWFCMDGKDFSKYQLFIQKTCSKNQTCIDEVNKFVGGLKKR